MPYEIAFCGVIAVEDTIYLMGGAKQLFTPPVSTVMAYQPESETWTAKAPLLKANAYISACVLNNKIYIFGGGDENFASYSYRSVQVFDLKSNMWETRKDMEAGRMAAGVCAVEGKIFMMSN